MKLSSSNSPSDNDLHLGAYAYLRASDLEDIPNAGDIITPNGTYKIIALIRRQNLAGDFVDWESDPDNVTENNGIQRENSKAS